MDQPILSIIIPSYNTSKYVDECLPTFIDERLFGNVVIYLIDDGATDDTKDKIMPYVEKYPQLFKFIHKENGGHGSVINYGVHKIVKTKYFKVIDGDDWVDTDQLVKLVDFLCESDVDLINTNYVEKYEEGSIKESICNKVFPNEPKFSDLILTIHSITFKTSIFIDNNIYVREKVFFEDNEYVLYPLQYVEKFVYLPLNVYQYRLGTNGQSVTVESRINKHSHLELVEADIKEKYLNILKADPFNIAISHYENSLYFFFLNDYIYAATLSQTKKEFIDAINGLDKRTNDFAVIYERIYSSKKYKFIKKTKMLPFLLIKNVLSGRFS